MRSIALKGSAVLTKVAAWAFAHQSSKRDKRCRYAACLCAGSHGKHSLPQSPKGSAKLSQCCVVPLKGLANQSGTLS